MQLTSVTTSLFCVCLSGVPLAQVLPLRFARDSEARFDPFGEGGQILVADFNGDRRDDVGFVGGRLYLSDPFGGFRPGPGLWGTSYGETDRRAVGDVDGDGDVDIVTIDRDWSQQTADAVVELNDGTGAFTALPGFRIPNYAYYWRDSRPVLVDVDRDGRLDMVCPGTPTNSLWINRGNATFTDRSQAQLVAPIGETELLAGDVNGDGSPDLIGARTVYLNDRGGRYPSASSTLPATTPIGRDRVLADADGDGDVDLVTPGALLLNDGRGVFQTATWQDDLSGLGSEPAFGMLHAVDIDRDGDFDLVYGTAPAVLLNDGRGRFTRSTSWVPEPLAFTWRVTEMATAMVDLDGNGTLDFVASTIQLMTSWTWGRTKVYVNEGTRLVPERSTRIPVYHMPTYTIAAGDVDGDGAPDLMIDDALFRNDGNGYFRGPMLGEVGGSRTALASPRAFLVDLDRDGDLDYVRGAADFSPAAYAVNDGSGRFTSRALPNQGAIGPLDVGDFDRDGAVDLLVATGVLRNDRTGTFVTAVPLPSTTGYFFDVQFLDFDGDGNLDVVRQSNDITEVFRSSGGVFQRVGTIATTSWRLLVGDFNGDGRDDFLSGTGLFLSRGDATFAFSSIGVYGIDELDVDGDGDLDLINPSMQIWLNDGSAGFQSAPFRVEFFGDNASRVAVADFDLDGDPDLAYSNLGRWESSDPGADGVLVNRTRQIVSTLPLRIGATFSVDVMVQPDVLPNPHVAFLFVGVPLAPQMRSRYPVLGLLGVNPFVALAPTFIPAPAGRASISLPVPLNPSLLGESFGFQAMVGFGPRLEDWRFTNLVQKTAL